MGDKYSDLFLACSSCGVVNGDIYFAPTSGFFTFHCYVCRDDNFICADFKCKNVQNVRLNDVINVISMSSNLLDEEQILEVAEGFYEDLKKHG